MAAAFPSLTRTSDHSDSRHPNHLALRLAQQCARRAEGLLHRRRRGPSESRERPYGGLLDKLVFGAGVRHG